MSARVLAVLALGLVATSLSLWVRLASAVRVAASAEGGGEAAWFASDPDSLYHMRRLARALESGGRIDARDPLLAFPEHEAQGGARIPWPSGYTRFLHALARAAGGPPREEALARGWVERLVASTPAALGALTSGAAAVAAALAAGPAAGLLAGAYHAFCFGSVRYSFLGQGDHHAWVSLWLLLALGATSWAFPRVERGRGAPAALAAGAAGACLGVALVSWVASLVTVGLLQLAWALLFVLRCGLPRRAYVAALLAFHGALAACVAPEALASPWPATEVVALSTFHLLEIALVGAWLASLPLWVPVRAGRARRTVLVGLGALVPLGWIALGPGGEGVRAGLAWAAGATPFMGWIRESQPLLGGPAGGLGVAAKWLGYGILALPLAAWPARRPIRTAHVPWIVVLPALLGMACLQRRFAEGASAPLAVVLGVAYGTSVVPLLRRFGRAAPGLVALLLASAAHPDTAWRAWERTRLGAWLVETEASARHRALRELVAGLGEDEPRESRAVLAEWDLGHLIEWVAARPTVADNFGDYLGRDGFLDSWRVLHATDDSVAEEHLARRRVAHVLVTADWARNAEAARRALSSELGRGGPPLAQRLLPRGHPDRPPGASDPGFLRRIAGARATLDGRDLGPVGWVFEVVPGAWIEARGEPGEVFELRIDLRGEREWFEARGVADGEGWARVRVPYATDPPEGAGAGLGPARWSLGRASGVVVVPEHAVRTGERLTLDLLSRNWEEPRTPDR